MDKKIKLSTLIAKTERKLKCFNFTPKLMNRYHNKGFMAIENYCNAQGCFYYSPDLINEFIIQSFKRLGRENKQVFRIIRKAAALLNEFYKTNALGWHHLPHWGHVLPLRYFESLKADFLEYMSKDCLYSSTLIAAHRAPCHHFLVFLEKNGHIDFSKITVNDVMSFLLAIAPQYPKSMGKLLASLRCLNRFLMENKLSPIDMTAALAWNAAPRRKLQTFFTKEEAEKIIAVIDRSTWRGKRDYAALLLAKNTGLRSCDICNLKLSEIDWNNQEIKLIQRKTGIPFALPLEAEVGNAIADYILNVRPAVDHPFIFVNLDRPFMKLTSGAIGDRLRQYMIAAGLKAHRRMHAFRRGFGTQMLEHEIPLPTISNILGHTSIDSAQPYLALNFKQLQCCALGLTDIPVSLEALQ